MYYLLGLCITATTMGKCPFNCINRINREKVGLFNIVTIAWKSEALNGFTKEHFCIYCAVCILGLLEFEHFDLIQYLIDLKNVNREHPDSWSVFKSFGHQGATHFDILI